MDAAIVFTAAPAAIPQAFRSLRRNGTLVLVGLSVASYELPLVDTVLKGITIRGSYLGSRDDLAAVFALAGQGLLRPHVHTHSLDEAPVASRIHAPRRACGTGRNRILIRFVHGRRKRLPAFPGIRAAGEREGHGGLSRPLSREPPHSPRSSGANSPNRSLHWFQKWTHVFEWNPPFAKWFAGGKINASYNCIDRHLTTARKNKVAILWEGEPGDQRMISYQELHRLVCRFANVLKARGLKAGDRAIIYMGMVPELPVALLACARLGITHSVVFGGFSAEALKARIQDLEAAGRHHLRRRLAARQGSPPQGRRG